MISDDDYSTLENAVNEWEAAGVNRRDKEQTDILHKSFKVLILVLGFLLSILLGGVLGVLGI